jgi:hypothetical protein
MYFYCYWIFPLEISRQLQYKERNSSSLKHKICTHEDGQLDRNM